MRFVRARFSRRRTAGVALSFRRAAISQVLPLAQDRPPRPEAREFLVHDAQRGDGDAQGHRLWPRDGAALFRGRRARGAATSSRRSFFVACRAKRARSWTSLSANFERVAQASRTRSTRASARRTTSRGGRAAVVRRAAAAAASRETVASRPPRAAPERVRARETIVVGGAVVVEGSLSAAPSSRRRPSSAPPSRETSAVGAAAARRVRGRRRPRAAAGRGFPPPRRPRS